MELQESMLMSARPHAGLTQLCPVTMEASQGTTTHTMDTPAMSVEPGTRTIADLTQKAQAGGRFGQIFQNMINEYSQCNVNWEQPTAPLVDISDFERANDNYSGAEEEVKTAPQVEQEQPY